MKRLILLLSLPLFWGGQSSHAYLVSPFADLNTYASSAQTVFIGECLPVTEAPVDSRLILRKLRILHVIHGSLEKGDIVPVLLGDPLSPGRLYLIYSADETVNAQGRLNAFSYEPGAVEIQLWGEITPAEKAKRLSKFFAELSGKPLREQFAYIFRKRLAQLRQEERNIAKEKELLGRAVGIK